MQDIINRHPFLAVIYLLVGGVLIAALLLAGMFGYIPGRDLILASYATCVVIAIVVLTLAYTYSLSFIELNDSGILATNYQTPFSSTHAECDWNTVQSVTYEQPGLFSKIFGFGTLLIQTAGAIPDISLTYVARAQYSSEVIDQRAALGGSPDA